MRQTKGVYLYKQIIAALRSPVLRSREFSTELERDVQQKGFRSLAVNLREIEGSNKVRKIRRQGLIPGVIYGPSRPRHVLVTTPSSLIEAELRERQGSFENTVYRLTVEEDQTMHYVIPQNLQLHRTMGYPISCNFLSFDPEKGLRRLRIPIVYGEREKCIDLKRGGLLNRIYFYAYAKIKGSYVPSSLVVSMANKKIGSRVRWSELEAAAPPNIELIRPQTKETGDLVIATILGKKSKSSASTEAAED